MERLLIIDGNNLLFQMFYGMPSAVYNEKGWPIHGNVIKLGIIRALKESSA